MTFIEKKLNKWLVKAVIGSSFFGSNTKDEEKHKGLLARIRDFFRSGIEEMQKDTKKIIEK